MSIFRSHNGMSLMSYNDLPVWWPRLDAFSSTAPLEHLSDNALNFAEFRSKTFTRRLHSTNRGLSVLRSVCFGVESWLSPWGNRSQVGCCSLCIHAAALVFCCCCCCFASNHVLSVHHAKLPDLSWGKCCRAQCSTWMCPERWTARSCPWCWSLGTSLQFHTVWFELLSVYSYLWFGCQCLPLR